MRERAIRFGSHGTLAGIVCEPAGRGATRAVVMVNSGILHRVGACRLHVKLARRLAERGVPSLRFDHSGIGDSEARRDSLPFEKSAVLEIREALDWLATKRGIERFTVLGLCSGADMAFEAAREEPRIDGLVLLDPWAYRTPRYWWTHYRARVTSAAAWRRLWERHAGRRVAPPAPTGPAAEEDLDLPTYVREFPPRERVAADLAAMAARGLRLLCLFSGGQGDHYNHAGQMRESFRDVDLGERLEEVFLPDADHIFTDLGHQQTVLRTVEGWLVAASDPAADAGAPQALPATAGSSA